MFRELAIGGMLLLIASEPFGGITYEQPDHYFAYHWRDVRKQWESERVILRCRDDCPSAARRFNALIDAAKRESGLARIGSVNRAINLAITPMRDIDNYGVVEIWTAPLTTLGRGYGDCTDFAIAKYFALGEIGISQDNRRIVVVARRRGADLHTVLAVLHDDRWLLLDNLTMRMVAADDSGYQPIAVIDHNGVRSYAVVVASRACDATG